MEPTPEQDHITTLIRTTKSNIIIRALAGTGKTTTLELIERASPEKPILCLAFNKKIAEEMAKRFATTTTVRTFNGLGHRIWGKACSANLKLDPKKSQALFKSEVDQLPKSAQAEAWGCYMEVINAVALAKSIGYVPKGVFPNAKRLVTTEAFHAWLEERPSALAVELIDSVLTRSIKTAYEGLIDFNDQIYMPALFGGTFPRFPHVMVDEGQDLSPVNHAMLDKLARGRITVVGDPKQSIYAFRGALTGGMSQLQRTFQMTECPLTVSFRCPRKVVEYARGWVPEFKWVKDGGSVSVVNGMGLDVKGLPEQAAIICRNNAPLFAAAIHLLSSGRSVSVAGSDIGPRVLATFRKLGPEDLKRPQVYDRIEEWRAEKLAKNSKTAQDIADCMRVFAAYGQTLGQAIATAEHIFAQKGSIKLLTGHKAKGLEFESVYHLDPWLIGQHEQDQNLHYVISTRSMDRLVEVNSKDIRW